MLRIILVFAITFFHPVHVSLTSIEYERDKNAFNVFMRLYYDDFLSDYSSSNEFLKEAAGNVADGTLKKHLGKYLDERFSIGSDGRIRNGKIMTVELRDNELSMNIEYRGIRNPSVVVVRNSIMTALYGDMANMVIVKAGGFEKGVKMTPGYTEETFIIK